MPISKKSRAVKPARPAADATCFRGRTIERGDLHLELWKCVAPRQGEPLDTPRRLGVAPVVKKIGRRLQRFFYVSRLDAEREDAAYPEAGWYFEAVNANSDWISNDPLGPYVTLEAAIEDAKLGAAAE